jgi:hypothetical protein
MDFRGLRDQSSCELRRCDRVSEPLAAHPMNLRFSGFFDDFLERSSNT